MHSKHIWVSQDWYWFANGHLYYLSFPNILIYNWNVKVKVEQPGFPWLLQQHQYCCNCSPGRKMDGPGCWLPHIPPDKADLGSKWVLDMQSFIWYQTWQYSFGLSLTCLVLLLLFCVFCFLFFFNWVLLLFLSDFSLPPPPAFVKLPPTPGQF